MLLHNIMSQIEIQEIGDSFDGNGIAYKSSRPFAIFQYEDIHPRMKQIKTLFEAYWGKRPIFVPTIITNAICGGFVTSEDNMIEFINAYISEQMDDNCNSQHEFDRMVFNAFYI